MPDDTNGLRRATIARFGAGIIVTGILLAAPIVSPAHAADASAWDGEARAAVRLIAGSPAGDPTGAVRRAGLEIRLGPGWKTYWRYPGDSGVPPRFDFARSDNIDSVALSWPAPHGFSDEGGKSIGYKGGVIFPLRIVPKDPARPVVLRVDVDYAVCEKLCVPATAKVELALDATVSPHDGALAASEARVPRPVAIGQAGPLVIRSVTRAPGGKSDRIVVEIAAPETATVELFAEGPTPDWALPIPEPSGASPTGSRLYAFEIDGVPPGASADGATLRLTAVSAAAAIEVTTRLDSSAAPD
jgi:DsbC/DsbD-like thiol-disulfide interchange protein